jgi:hypothetical protein
VTPAPLRATYHVEYNLFIITKTRFSQSAELRAWASRRRPTPDVRRRSLLPYIGGAFDIKPGSPNCGGCWKLIDKANNAYFTAIEHSNSFDLSGLAFNALLDDGIVGRASWTT